MKFNIVKLVATALVVMPLVAVAIFNGAPVKVEAGSFGDGASAYTEMKCVMCHKANAVHFDKTKADADLVQIILDGKKPETGMAMPAYKAKIDAAAAQELVTYMKSIKKD